MRKPSCLSLLLGGLLACQGVTRKSFSASWATSTSNSVPPQPQHGLGLVKPSATGSFHGGLDLSHDSGLLRGPVVTEHGLDASGNNLEIDSTWASSNPSTRPSATKSA